MSWCLSHLESKGPLDLTDIPSTDRERQCSWRGVEATTSVRESTITHRECTCCGPSTKNREPLCQLGYVLGGARWRLPTDSLPSQVDLERGRASYWVAQLFKCKFISFTTRHYFSYLEIYLVRGKHPTSAYIFERKCRSYVSNHQVWGTSSFRNIISRLQGDAWLLIASMCMYLWEEVLILAKARGSSPICDLNFERRRARYLAEVLQTYNRYEVRTQ